MQVRRLVFALVTLLVILIVQLGATFGLVFAVVAVTSAHAARPPSARPQPRYCLSLTQRPRGVCAFLGQPQSEDSKVDGGGALVARDGSYLGTTPVLLAVTSSEVGDDVFADVRSIYVETPATGVTALLAVDGFVRLPLSALGNNNAAGLTYGPLVLFTAQGNWALVGETLTPLDTTLSTFATTAAAQISALGLGSSAGRHLLGAAGGRDLQSVSSGTIVVGASTGSRAAIRPSAVSAPRGL
jgi:hypothetical protein